jgi:hypothetical protein
MRGEDKATDWLSTWLVSSSYRNYHLSFEGYSFGQFLSSTDISNATQIDSQLTNFQKYEKAGPPSFFLTTTK